jgi:CheY-like chemotaxis protein
MSKASDFSQVTALLVEDNKINQMLVKKMLENLGCQVLIANSGTEALNIVENQQPDIILTDIQMPHMDGLQLARILKTHCKPSIACIPILALTGYAEIEEKNAALSSGILEIIVKPFGLEELKLALCRTLGINPNTP